MLTALETCPDISRPTPTKGQGRQQQGRLRPAASLSQTGLYPLSFPPLSPLVVARRLGYRYPVLDAFGTGFDQDAGQVRLEAFQRSLVGCDYQVGEKQVSVSCSYPLRYDFFHLELPVAQLQLHYPQLLNWLLEFWAIARKVGVSFWFENMTGEYVMNWLEDSLEEDELEEDVASDLRSIITQTKQLEAAIQGIGVPGLANLHEQLHQASGSSEYPPEAQAVIATLLHWWSLLAEDDHIDNYTEVVEEDAYEDTEVIAPSDRFLLLPDWGEYGEEYYNITVQEAHALNVVWTHTIDQPEEGLAVPTFPMRLSKMVMAIIVAVQNLNLPKTP